MSSNEHPDMSGSGCDDPEPTMCPRCMGTGKYRRAPWDDEKLCSICDGTGVIVDPPDYEPEMDDVL